MPEMSHYPRKKDTSIAPHSAALRDGFDAHAEGNRAAPNTIEIKTYDIHEIIRGDGSCPITFKDLQWLIGCQAALHGSRNVEDEGSLRRHIDRNASSFRGFVLHAEGKKPIAYAIYYQMVDGKGNKAAYCEDFFINEAFRGRGVANILFQELADRTIKDNALYLQWATDARNAPVLDYVRDRLHAKTPEDLQIVTIAASSLLSAKRREQVFGHDTNAIFTDGKTEADFITRPIIPNDLPHLRKVGLGSELINHTGAMPFKGYITHRHGNENQVVAITPGWKHFSTFQLREGLHLEQPSFDDSLTSDEKERVIASIVESVANTYTKGRNRESQQQYNHLRWHIHRDDSFMMDFLVNRAGLSFDKMTDSADSTLLVHQLENGNLLKLAKSTPKRTLENITVFPNSHRQPAGENPPPP